MYYTSTILSVAALTSVALGALEGKDFRIMPLGASITHGSGSSTGNGYRLDLYNKLKKGNTTVDFIGSQKSGNMTHNRNEGHPGAIISQMLGFSKDSIKENPNVILLFVGSNNMNKDTDATNAPADMGKTLDGLFKAAPDAAILVSSLTTSKDAAAAKRIEQYAKSLAPVVKTRADAGRHVQLIDMTKLLDTKTDFKDGLHPNDAGFKKIADSWYKGLEEVEKKGWIKDPVGKGKTSTKTEKTKTHDESQSESEKESHDKSKKVNADGSKVETNKDQESSKNAAAESDRATENTTTKGPDGTKTSNSATAHDESNSASQKESNEKTVKTGANGSKEISTKTAEEQKAAEEEANSKKNNTNIVNADGSTSSSSSSSDDSSNSSSESSSTTESTQTFSKRSAKFRLLK